MKAVLHAANSFLIQNIHYTGQICIWGLILTVNLWIFFLWKQVKGIFIDPIVFLHLQPSSDTQQASILHILSVYIYILLTFTNLADAFI